ncbi:Bug family tripartite tricarboxylate transporter substrate binding protein [Roseomonas populi]|uniref:Tripartite tricarboxylate transporter substrate binding protein n=1 Tax=Roseomonas populi TaxID=3121582 RepID=A0ABT1X4G4_9PROT|nr:tripartite tricarboxylate transporter substrate binding protein [Roseomonas pecuniae]MCR0982614.1 tripartite tricarboxylate transporter substrate binding protein [Roseomonas pecuniae]
MPFSTSRRSLIMAGAALTAGPARVWAQERYPAKPITLVIPFPPGASTDLVGRPLAQRMSEALGVPVVVENRAGAGGMLGSEYVARQKPDGYTLEIALNATHGLISLFNRNVSYDPFRDFSYVVLAASAPTAFMAHPSVPASNVAELLDYARRSQDNLQVGSSGVGSHHHLGVALLRQRTGLPFVHVPFRGGGEAMTALIGGHVPLAFGTLSTALEAARGKQVKILGLMDAERATVAPGVPTIGETLEGYSAPSVLIGVLGPARMPEPVVARLNATINEALSNEAVRTRLMELGVQPVGGTPDAFRDRFRADMDRFRGIMETAGIQPE